MKRVFLHNAFVIALVTFSICGSHAEPGQSSRPAIALNVPLSAELAVYGQPVVEGFKFAEEELNATPGGFPFTLDIEDNRSFPARAVTVARTQLARHPVLYISGVFPQVVAIEPLVAREAVPHVVMTYETDVRQRVQNTYRSWVNFQKEPALHAETIAKARAKRVAIAYVNLPTTYQTYEKETPALLKAQGVDVFVQSFDYGDDDFSSLVSRMAVYRPDRVIVCAFQQQLLGLIRTLRRQRVTHDENTTVSFDLLDAATELSPEELEGLLVVTPRFLLPPLSATYEEWEARFKRRFGKSPLYTHAFAYDLARLLAEEAPANISSPEQVHQILQKTRYVGLTGAHEFSGRGDRDIEIGLGVYRQGRLETWQGN